MAVRTHLEALTAELLGDVGALHDEVKALRAALPDATAEVNRSLERKTAALQNAANDMRTLAAEMMKKISAATASTIALEVRKGRADLAEAATAAAEAAIGAEARRMVATLEAAGAGVVAQTHQASLLLNQPTPAWQIWLLVVLGFAGGAMIGAMATLTWGRVNDQNNVAAERIYVDPAQPPPRPRQ